MRSVAMELVRMSELIIMSLLLGVRSPMASPNSVASVNNLSLDRFSGELDECGDTICTALLRPLITCVDWATLRF